MGRTASQVARIARIALACHVVTAVGSWAAAGELASASLSSNVKQVFDNPAPVAYINTSRPRSQCQTCPPACVSPAPGQTVSPGHEGEYGDAPLPGDLEGALAPSDSDSSAISPRDFERATMARESFAGLGSDTMSLADAFGGYIDNPIVGTWFRVRYDHAWNNTVPDRAQYLYMPQNPTNPNSSYSDQSPIPKIDFQDISPYFELQVARRLSIFAEVPVRTVTLHNATLVANGKTDQFGQALGSPVYDGTVNAFTGLGDMNCGFKYALKMDPDQYFTFQLKNYIPTGNAFRFLGNNLYAIEPGFLYLARLTNRMYFQGEARYWIPFHGSKGYISQSNNNAGNFVPWDREINEPFAGSIFRYGGGLGYDLIRPDSNLDVRGIYTSPNGLRVTPIVEAVGWSVVNGFQTVNLDDVIIASTNSRTAVISARDTTIINLKLGVRTSYGPRSIYVGWGHALTTQNWYTDLFRIEYRRLF